MKFTIKSLYVLSIFMLMCMPHTSKTMENQEYTHDTTEQKDEELTTKKRKISNEADLDRLCKKLASHCRKSFQKTRKYINPKHTSEFFNSAIETEKKCNIAVAKNLFAKSVEYSGNIEALSSLGELYKEEEPAKAKRCFKHYIALKHEYTNPFDKKSVALTHRAISFLGDCYTEEKKFNKALECYKKSAQSEVMDYSHIGDVYAERCKDKSDLSKAEKYYLKLITSEKADFSEISTVLDNLKELYKKDRFQQEFGNKLSTIPTLEEQYSINAEDVITSIINSENNKDV